MQNEATANIDSSEHDQLLAALVYLTHAHMKPRSAESLRAGLPLENGRLTPALFVRAAENAGFNASLVERAIDNIPEQVLPVVLLLEPGHACVLLEISGTLVRVLFPGEGASPIELELETLQQRYAGNCLMCKPVHESDSSETTARSGHWFWDTIAQSRGIYMEVLVASLMVNLFALVTPLFVMNVYDRVVPNHAVETLWVLASGVMIVFGFDLTIKILRGYFIDIAGKRADILLSAKTFSRVMDIRMDHRPARVGAFANNLQEFDSFREFFTSTTLVTLIDLPFVVLFILIIYSIGGPLAFVPLLAIPLVLLVSLAIQRPLQSLINQTFTESSKKHAMLIESLSALDAIKGARAEGVIQGRWEAFNSQLAKLALKSRLLTMGSINFAQLVQQSSTVAVVITGVYLIMAGDLSVGGLIACTILTGRCVAPIGQVAGIMTRYHHAVAAFESIDRMMNLPVERPKGKQFLHRQVLDGSVTLKNLSFAYPNQQVAALNSVNLQINAGEKVAIVGKMGSGKTTLQRLIMGFYRPSDGAIQLGGTDINQLDPTDIRRNITYVPQDVQLLSGTIRENISFGSPFATDEQILEAARFSGLLPFIDTHPEGFDLQVGERGLHLSGGQRQAIALSRAFIHPAPLLLLDEPTTAMDNSAEIHFKQRLEAFARDRTLILITHKSNMLSLADRLIVMNEGNLVADGPREDIVRILAGGNREQG